MADIMRDGEYKTKVKKKRKRDEDCHDYSLIKLKRKKTSSKEEENECMDNTHTLYKKRKREGSESESDWSARRESNTELIQRKAERRMGKTEQGTELVIRKKKKRKVKRENNPEESRVTELPAPKKKKAKKKKKKREKEEIQNSATEHSIFEPAPAIEGRKEEDVDAFAGHIFLKPFPVQERRGEKKSLRGQRYRESGKADTAAERELSHSYRDKRVSKVERGEKSNSFLNKGKPEERQREDLAEPEQGRAEKRRLPGPTTCQAYSDSHGWETDTSLDDLDYSDDYYHESPSTLRNRINQWRKKPSKQNHVVYSEGQEVEGFVSDPRYFSDNEDFEWITVEVPSDKRSSPGLMFRERECPTLEEALYKFPPGVGVPPEEVVEVRDEENYWMLKDEALQPSSFADEAKEYIDSKIRYIEDYFHRLQCGHLTPSELKETRPENFDEPFCPTPRQLKFLNSLNIKVNWPLSDLHMFHLNTYTLPPRARAGWLSMKIFADTSRLSPTEEKILARNWFAFQKEYSFYDLRPFLSVRTARLGREAGQLVVQPYEYVSHANKVHFLLYMAKDLPNRTLIHISRRLHKILPFLRGQCLLRQSQRVSGLVLAKLLYVTQLFGADMLAAELLIGPSLKSYYTSCFATHIMLRYIKMRVGPWREDENERFLRGLKEVMHVKNYEEAYKLKRVPWMRIFPYVRTRSVTYMRRRLIVLTSRVGGRDNVFAMRNQMARFIRLLYSERVDDFTCLDWEGLARQVGATNPIRLVWSFRKLYFNCIPYSKRETVPEGLQYMYDHLLSYYEAVNPYRIPQAGEPDYQEHQHSQYNPNNPSNLGQDPNSELADPSVGPSNSSINSTDFSSAPHKPGMGSSNPEDPSNDPSDSSNESTNFSIATHNSDNPNYTSNPRIASSNKDDCSNHMITNAHHQNYPVKFKKGSTSHLYDPKNRKLGSNPDDLRTFKKVNNISQYDLNYLIKPSSSNSHKPRQQSHHLLEGDRSSLALSNQCDLENYFNSCDLSDYDDGLTSSESDSDDFETETLGQAIGRNVSAIRGSE